MDEPDVRRWFGEYLGAFAACCRGERDATSLLDWFGVPLLITTPGGFFAPTTDEQVVAALQPQVDGMRAAGFGRNEVVDSRVTVLNETSALYDGTISRRDADGSEISRLVATYLVTDGSAGRRISVLAVRSS